MEVLDLFEITLGGVEWWRAILILLCVMSFFHAICCRCCNCVVWVFVIFIKNQVVVAVWPCVWVLYSISLIYVLSGPSILFHWSLYLFLCQCCPATVAVIVLVKSGIDTANSILFIQDDFAYVMSALPPYKYLDYYFLFLWRMLLQCWLGLYWICRVLWATQPFL